MASTQPQVIANGAVVANGSVIANGPGEDDVEVIKGSIQASVVAQIVIATAAAVGLIYLLKPVLVIVLVAILLAFCLEPVVLVLERVHVSRPAGAAVALLLLLALSGALIFFFYNRAVDFLEELPKFSEQIRDDLEGFRAQAEKIENSTRSVLPLETGKKQPIPVQVQESNGLAKMISSGASQFGEIALAVSFVPFLIYFMLTWKTHVHSATLRVFPKEKRLIAYRTIGRISDMVRSFIAGNLFVGLLNAAASTAVFGAMHLPYFYFLGVISAFVGLIPYLGVFFALLAPIAAGMGVLGKSQLAVVFVAVVVLHILTMNLLYPKLIGRRLRLNPLAVALSLLFWAWIWGAFGLLLAIPLMGTAKIMCDYVEPLQGLGEWLGD